jgi:hypothetical protein
MNHGFSFIVLNFSGISRPDRFMLAASLPTMSRSIPPNVVPATAIRVNFPLLMEWQCNNLNTTAVDLKGISAQKMATGGQKIMKRAFISLTIVIVACAEPALPREMTDHQPQIIRQVP